MRVLVTGGAGFIGSHIVDALLLGGHSVAVIDDLSSGEQANVPAQAKFFQVDVRDQASVTAAVQSFKPEAVCHQAAQMSVSRSVREPHFDADVNILGLINVVSAAAEAGAKRVVFASSGGVLYGEATKPAPEETPANPISPYGISKWAGEQYLKFFHREYGLNCIALRYSNVYGERQNPHGEAGVVAIFCTRMFKGDVSRVNGDGKYVRDYVHVSDVVRANVAAIQSDAPGFEPINVGTGIGTDVNELAAELLTLCRAELKRRGINRAIPELEHGPARAGDLRSNLVANEKAQRLLKWSPRVQFTQGLEKTVGWFADRLLS